MHIYIWCDAVCIPRCWQYNADITEYYVIYSDETRVRAADLEKNTETTDLQEPLSIINFLIANSMSSHQIIYACNTMCIYIYNILHQCGGQQINATAGTFE